MLRSVRAQAYKLIILQLVVVAALAILWWIFKNITSGYSAVLGGIACIIPSWYFIRKFFSKKRRTPQAIISSFYLGELTKLFLSMVLLILVVKFTPAIIVPTLTGFIGAYLASAVSLFCIRIH